MPHVIWWIVAVELIVGCYLEASAVIGCAANWIDYRALRLEQRILRSSAPDDIRRLGVIWSLFVDELVRVVGYSLIVPHAANVAYGLTHGFRITSSTYLGNLSFLAIEVMLVGLSERARLRRRRLMRRRT